MISFLLCMFNPIVGIGRMYVCMYVCMFVTYPFHFITFFQTLFSSEKCVVIFGKVVLNLALSYQLDWILYFLHYWFLLFFRCFFLVMGHSFVGDGRND